MKLIKLFGILLFVIAFAGNVMGQIITYKVNQNGVNGSTVTKEGNISWFSIDETSNNTLNLYIYKDNTDISCSSSYIDCQNLGWGCGPVGNTLTRSDWGKNRTIYVIVDCTNSTPSIKFQLTPPDSGSHDEPSGEEHETGSGTTEQGPVIGNKGWGTPNIADGGVGTPCTENSWIYEVSNKGTAITITSPFGKKYTTSTDVLKYDSSNDCFKIETDGTVYVRLYRDGTMETNASPFTDCTVDDGRTTYELKKYSKRTPTEDNPLPYDITTEETIYIRTDKNGNINYELTSGDNHIYVNFDDIKCTNFTLTTSASDHCNSQFINKGKIIASENISLGTSDKKIGGTGYDFACEGAYIANNFYTYNNNETPAIKGRFLITNNFNIAEAQGQNFKIDECADVKAKNANINFSGGTMQLIVDGHIVAEKMIVNNMVIVKDNGILTVGDTEIAGGINFVGGPNSLINLCKNPTINGRDNLGGTCGTILYNYGEGGWKDTDPEKEDDVNYYANSNDKYQAISALNAAGIYNITDIKASEKVAMYSSYNDCIAEKGLPSFLGIEDDPFLPKDKEIRRLYNCNPCSNDFEDTKIELREIHGRTFRLINGELIYCENDNDN